MSATPFVKASGLAVDARLADVDFEWSRSSTVAIVGPSGSGKTTLLRLLAGFEAPDRGRLEIDGVLSSTAGRILSPPETRHLAFAFQEPALMPHMDAMANVCLGIRGSMSSRLAAARQALIDVGLEGFERRRVWQLSGGEAQRIQLARILASDANMLLLDEPFASVDRMCRADLLSRIGSRLKSGARTGVTAIVTHDPADAMELADLVMVMKAGRIVALGDFAQIASGSCGAWPAQFLVAGLAGKEIA